MSQPKFVGTDWSLSDLPCSFREEGPLLDTLPLKGPRLRVRQSLPPHEQVSKELEAFAQHCKSGRLQREGNERDKGRRRERPNLGYHG